MVYELSSLCKMKDQDSQEQAPISELVANLLRTRLASKLPESEITSLISETKEIVEKKNQATCPSEPQIEQQVSKLKGIIDYIEHKCRELERSHVRHRREIYRCLRPVSSSLTVTRSPTVLFRRSHNPWFDIYFS